MPSTCGIGGSRICSALRNFDRKPAPQPYYAQGYLQACGHSTKWLFTHEQLARARDQSRGLHWTARQHVIGGNEKAFHNFTEILDCSQTGQEHSWQLGEQVPCVTH